MFALFEPYNCNVCDSIQIAIPLICNLTIWIVFLLFSFNFSGVWLMNNANIEKINIIIFYDNYTNCRCWMMFVLFLCIIHLLLFIPFVIMFLCYTYYFIQSFHIIFSYYSYYFPPIFSHNIAYFDPILRTIFLYSFYYFHSIFLR